MFTVHKFIVRERQADYINRLLNGCLDGSRQLFVHILWCQTGRRSLGVDGYVPVYSREIRRHFGRYGVMELVNRGLIVYRKHDVERGESREFKIPIPIIVKFLRLGTEEGPTVNLVSHRRQLVRVGSPLYDSARHPYSEIIRKALMAFNASPVTVDFARAEQLIRIREEHLNAIGWTDTRQAARLMLDMASLNGMKMATEAYGNASFINTYDVTSSGRFSAPFGPLVNTRTMTAALFEGVGRNYDLLRAHDALMIQLFQDLHPWVALDTSWLVDYSENLGVRSRIAKNSGLTDPTVKAIVHALKNGAVLINNPKNEFDIRRMVRIDLELKAGNRSIDVLIAGAFASLEHALKPLMKQLKKFHRFLAAPDGLRSKTIDTSLVKVSRRHGRVFVTNAIGHTFSPFDGYAGLKINDKVNVKKMTSFLLTGGEAAIIKSLETDMFDAEIGLLSDCHDGLITAAPVPNGAVEQVLGKLGIRNGSLVEKPFSLSDNEPQTVTAFFNNPDYDSTTLTLNVDQGNQGHLGQPVGTTVIR